METQSFVLGVLATYGVTMTAFVIVGMVKISRLVKQQRSLENFISNLNSEIDNKDKEVRRILSETNREITMVERTIMQRIDKEIDEAHRHIHDEVQIIQRHDDELERKIIDIDKTHKDLEMQLFQDLSKKISESISYTDSRIDKVVAQGVIRKAERPTK